MIKTSKHSLQFSNTNKKSNLSLFIDEYRKISKLILDDIWYNGYEYTINNIVYNFNINTNQLEFPQFIDYNKFNIDTFLTARTLRCLTTQLSGIIRAEIEKQRKRIYILNKLKDDKVPRPQRHLLVRKLKQNIPTIPNVNNINPELNTICIEFIKFDRYFNVFLKIKSITKDKLEIILPIKFHKHSNKFKDDNFERMNSFLISKNNIYIRWKKDDVVKKDVGIIVGADQGYKDIITLSDTQVTPKTDIHNHSLETIIAKLSRKNKGSKNFKKAQEHRKNFINWSINQLNFNNIQQVNLEQIYNIGYKTTKSRKMSHWTNTLIRDKVESKCNLLGVLVKHQSSTYRSQRCSECGIVLKSNRKGKLYSCKLCGNIIDADFNASKNHEVKLTEIPYNFRKLNLNRKGFYWLETGLFDLEGRSLQSLPLVKE